MRRGLRGIALGLVAPTGPMLLAGCSLHSHPPDAAQAKIKPDYSALTLGGDEHRHDSFSVTMQAVSRMYGRDADGVFGRQRLVKGVMWSANEVLDIGHVSTVSIRSESRHAKLEASLEDREEGWAHFLLGFREDVDGK